MDTQKLIEKIESDEDFRALIIEAETIREEVAQLKEKLQIAERRLEQTIREAKRALVQVRVS